jgi:hypothetical protein
LSEFAGFAAIIRYLRNSAKLARFITTPAAMIVVHHLNNSPARPTGARSKKAVLTITHEDETSSDMRTG